MGSCFVVLRFRCLAGLLLFVMPYGSAGWDNTDLEIFDLVDEIPGNFYDILNVKQSASAAEIRRAYRRLSLELHPDKNKEANAEEKFRQLTAVAEVLRDPDKRDRYDAVLRDGLPDWRQPVFYFRKVRRMGTLELLAALAVISTVGHFGYGCAVYLEHFYQFEEAEYKRKKKSKKSKGRTPGNQTAEQDDGSAEKSPQVHFPGLFDLLPVKLIVTLVWLVRNGPSEVLSLWHRRQERLKEEEEWRKAAEQQLSEEREMAARADEIAAEARQRRVERQQQLQREAFEAVLISEDGLDWGLVPQTADESEGEREEPETLTAKTSTNKPWTEDEVAALSRAVVRFPGGTGQRWEKIAREVGRSVSEVTQQVKKMKRDVSKSAMPVGRSSASTVAGKRASQAASQLTSDITLRSDVGEGAGGSSDTASEASSRKGRPWTQAEQRLLEQAMSQFGKDVPNRWERVAEVVPGRSKEQCMERYKGIVLLLRQRKAAPTASSTEKDDRPAETKK